MFRFQFYQGSYFYRTCPLVRISRVLIALCVHDALIFRHRHNKGPSGAKPQLFYEGTAITWQETDSVFGQSGNGFVLIRGRGIRLATIHYLSLWKRSGNQLWPTEYKGGTPPILPPPPPHDKYWPIPLVCMILGKFSIGWKLVFFFFKRTLANILRTFSALVVKNGRYIFWLI